MSAALEGTYSLYHRLIAYSQPSSKSRCGDCLRLLCPNIQGVVFFLSVLLCVKTESQGHFIKQPIRLAVTVSWNLDILEKFQVAESTRIWPTVLEACGFPTIKSLWWQTATWTWDYECGSTRHNRAQLSASGHVSWPWRWAMTN